MAQKFFISFITFIVLTGYAQSIHRDIASEKSESDIMNDGGIGYVILSTEKNNKKFEIIFFLAEEDTADCKNSLIIGVLYDGFEPRTAMENIRLRFDLLSEDDKPSQIEVKSDTLSTQELKKLNEATKGMTIANMRDFTIKKDVYKKLLNSKSIKYLLKTDTHNVSGEFSQESILDLKKYSKKLLADVCYKGSTIEQLKQGQERLQELMEGFIDVIVLKAGAAKADIEKHFQTQFKNRVKDPDTGAYEETVNLKLYKEDAGPLIIGFDEKDKLIYTRNFFDKADITYLKQ